jgi:hypothetical protein
LKLVVVAMFVKHYGTHVVNSLLGRDSQRGCGRRSHFIKSVVTVR